MFVYNMNIFYSCKKKNGWKVNIYKDSCLEHVNKMSFFMCITYINLNFTVVKQNWTESSHLQWEFTWNMLIKCNFFVFNMYIYFTVVKKNWMESSHFSNITVTDNSKNMYLKCQRSNTSVRIIVSKNIALNKQIS